MLGLTRIELIFFIVVSVGLCFGFMLGTVLIVQGSLVIAEQCFHRAKAFSASHPTLSLSRLGLHKALEGDAAQRADLS